MKKVFLTITALVVVSSAVFSQGELDAFKMSQTDLRGTARYLSMGGAFGALGGDISSMNNNPAGLAVYRSTEFVATLSLNAASAESSWEGNKATGDRTRVYFDNIGYVGYFPTPNSSGLVGWTVGFSYNRLKNFNRKYSLRGGTNINQSLTDYIVQMANGLNAGDLSDKGQDPYSNTNNNWLSVLGYNGGLIEPYSDSNNTYYGTFGEMNNGIWTDYNVLNTELNVTESGGIDLYNMAFGLNFSDIVLLGASAAVTDMNYRYHSYYAEDFEKSNYLDLENWFKTEGTGYSFNIGAIVRPADFLRFGVAYNSPTWYKLTDYYTAQTTSRSTELGDIYAYSPTDAYTDYEYRSADRWIFSAAAILGQTALISVDYELTGYKNMKLYDRDGYEYTDQNSYIREDFKNAGTLRLGAEVKVTPQFAVRAGAAWIGNPTKDKVKDGLQEMATVGTIPNYTILKSISNYTVGFGYRFTPNFYMDIACVLKSMKEDAYAYSNLYDKSDNLIIASKPASLKTNTTRVALTLGYKF